MPARPAVAALVLLYHALVCGQKGAREFMLSDNLCASNVNGDLIEFSAHSMSLVSPSSILRAYTCQRCWCSGLSTDVGIIQHPSRIKLKTFFSENFCGRLIVPYNSGWGFALPITPFF